MPSTEARLKWFRTRTVTESPLLAAKATPHTKGGLAELALQLTPLGLEISCPHVGSEYNESCDRLSRDMKAPLSASALTAATRTVTVKREFAYLGSA